MKRFYPITVAIVTFKRSDKLKNCLDSLVKQTVVPSEILIVDNGPDYKTKKVAGFFLKKLPVRYIVEHHQGIPYARNAALRHAKGKILAFIDDDCQASETWVEEIIKAHKKHPGVAAVVGQTESYPPASVFSIIKQLKYDFWFSKNIDEKGFIKILDTKNVSINLNVVKRLQILFDTNFSRGSDVDFAKQIIHKGHKIFYNKEMIAIHTERRFLIDFLKQTYLIGQSQARLEFKWPNEFKSSIKAYLFTKFEVPSYFEHDSLFKNMFLNFSYYLHEVFYYKGIFSLYRNSLLQSIHTITNHDKNLSVAIVTKDRPFLLRNCLLSLCRQRLQSGEVLVIDNNSKDKNTKKIVLSFNKILPIRYIFESRIGIPFARNTALKEAKGNILAFIDDDCEAAPDWLLEMVKAHKQNPLAVAVAGKSYVLNKDSVFGKITHRFSTYWMHYSMGEGNEISTLDTQNASFKRELLTKHNCWFDNSIVGYGEDTDFAKQLIFKKLKIIFASKSILFFKARSTLWGFLKQRFLIGMSNVRTEEKWSLKLHVPGTKIIPGSIHTYALASWYQIPTFRIIWFLADAAYQAGRTTKKGILLYQHFSDQKIPQKRFLEYLKSEYKKGFISVIDPLFQDKKQREATDCIKNKFFLMLAYVISIGVYQKGKQAGEIFAKKIDLEINKEDTIKKTTLQCSVAVVTRNRDTSLKRLLISLANQSNMPHEVLIIDNGSDDLTRHITSFFKRYLPIRYIHEKKIGIPYARNKVLRYATGEIVAFIDDDCQAEPDWVEHVVSGNEKYKEVFLLQGLSVSAPKKSIFSVVSQFNRQTWIRDNMLGDRNLYWDWIDGRLKRDFKVLICDTRNVSLKMHIQKKHRLFFDEKLDRGSDVEFGNQALSKGESIVLYPKARVNHYERSSVKEFIIQKWYQGRTSQRIHAKWPREYSVVPAFKRTFFRRLASFGYYCLVNKYILQLPVLILLFIVNRISFGLGKRHQKQYALL